MKLSLSFLFALVLCTACNSQHTQAKNLSVAEFEKGIKREGTQLIDVRTPQEFVEKHIDGAKNININDASFEKQMNALDKSKPLYIYCLAGGRSKKAADFAASNGFIEVYNLEYGINDWLKEKKPLIAGEGKMVPVNSVGLSLDDYLAHLKATEKLVLVDFNAVWCGPCKTLKPIVHKVAKKQAAKVELFDIDVDKNSTLANAMNVRSIPLLILYKQGKEVWRSLGLVDETLLTQKVDLFSK